MVKITKKELEFRYFRKLYLCKSELLSKQNRHSSKRSFLAFLILSSIILSSSTSILRLYQYIKLETISIVLETYFVGPDEAGVVEVEVSVG